MEQIGKWISTLGGSFYDFHIPCPSCAQLFFPPQDNTITTWYKGQEVTLCSNSCYQNWISKYGNSLSPLLANKKGL